MRFSERLALAALYNIDPERGHGLSIAALKSGFTNRPGPITSTRLKTRFAGLDLPNPVGLAAGFDKNAEVIAPLLKTGFGFVEVGAATPLPQPGNPKPRLFRLREDQASINRFGFNNEGAEVIASRLYRRPQSGIVGINLGANKTSDDRAADFAKVLESCGPHVDFATVNVSSPNTEKLRDLQGKEALTSLLEGVLEKRAHLQLSLPVLLKIAPDLSDRELQDVAEVALQTGIDGIVATNTTLDREGLQSPDKSEAGGMAGKPLFEKSTRVLARLSQLVDGQIPLVGVGGISSPFRAYQKIRAGASAVQFYTALVYGGFSLVEEITRGLDQLLERDGFANVSEAVGVDRDKWLSDAQD